MIGSLFDKADRDGQPLTDSSLKNDYWSIKQHLVIHTSNIIRKPWDCFGYWLIARVSFYCSTLIFLIARLVAILVLLGLEKITKIKIKIERLDGVPLLYWHGTRSFGIIARLEAWHCQTVLFMTWLVLKIN